MNGWMAKRPRAVLGQRNSLTHQRHTSWIEPALPEAGLIFQSELSRTSITASHRSVLRDAQIVTLAENLADGSLHVNTSDHLDSHPHDAVLSRFHRYPPVPRPHLLVPLSQSPHHRNSGESAVSMDTQERSDQFPVRLRERCADYAEQYGYQRTQLGQGFEGYLAHLFARESGFDEILEGQDTDPPDLGDVILRQKDLGVDVVLEDSQNKQLLIVQSKWLGKNTAFPIGELQSFFSLHDKLLEPQFIASGSDIASELLGAYRDKIRDRYTARFRFVVNRPLPSTTRISSIQTVSNNRYEKQGTNIVCEIFGQTELKELEHQVRSAGSGILDTIDFSVRGNDAVVFHEPQHSLICRISGNELTNLYEKHKQELFALNIRLPMSLDRVINRSIRDTADSEPENFFFYNNGVSAVCSNFTYDQAKNLVVANRFQIINGAQTVGAIAGAASTQHLSVLFRLTATGDTSGGHFTDNIIRYNNTQNPIQISDFRANDEIQDFLREHLVRRSGKGAAPSFIYQPKRGRRPGGRGGFVLTSDQLARIRYSFVHGPVRTYREPKLLFDTSASGLYWWAFGHCGSPVHSWTEHQLDEATVAIALDQIFKKEGGILRKELKERRQRDTLEWEPRSGQQSYGEANYLFRLARYLVGLVSVGLQLHHKNTFETYHGLLSNTSHFNEITETLVDDARRIVRFEVRNRTQIRAESQPDYNLARDDLTWERLRNEMADETRNRLRKSNQG